MLPRLLLFWFCLLVFHYTKKAIYFYFWYNKDLEEMSSNVAGGSFIKKQYQGKDIMETISRAYNYEEFEKQLIKMEKEFINRLKEF